MKIALCLSGQPRYLDQGYKALFDNVLSKHDVDVFSHIWFDEQLVDQDIKFCIQYNRAQKWEKDSDKKIVELYKPKKWVFETPKQFPVEAFKDANFEQLSSDPSRVLSMFYSIKQANKLKKKYEQENNFVYDLVIRARTDLVINNNLDFKNIDSNKVYCYHVHVSHENLLLCNDQFAVSSSKNMDVYSSLFDKLEYYWINDKPWSMVGERILSHHLYKTETDIYYCNDSELYVNIIKQ